MRSTTLLLTGELTKALYAATPLSSSQSDGATSSATNTSSSSTSLSAVTASPTEKLSSTSLAVATQRHVGKITQWDPFERHGLIQDAHGVSYRIINTRAFETVLPTMLRTLEGAAVAFEVDKHVTKTDRVIIRSRLDLITEESYRLKPPVDFFAPDMLRHLQPKHRAAQTGNESTDATKEAEEGIMAAQAECHAHERHTAEERAEKVELFAKDIVVDLASIPATQIARWHGPLSEEEVIKPTKNLKDMRSSRIFDRETTTYLKLKQQLGSAAEAKRLIEEQRKHAAAAAARREVVAENVAGVILAWSGIHRSGLIREGTATDEEVAETSSADVAVPEADASHRAALCIIRNVHAFQSALPTSQSLLRRRVAFTKVAYTTQPNRIFAENIIVEGDVRYDTAVASAEEAHKAKGREKAELLRCSHMGALILEDGEPHHKPEVASKEAGSANSIGRKANSSPKTDAASAAAAATPQQRDSEMKREEDPQKMHYGVIVRWSGGQGVIEGGDGRHFFLRSVTDFVKLVDPSAHHLRGAVVQFRRDAADARYACAVDVLSTAATTVAEVKPMLEKTQFAAFVSSQGDRNERDIRDGAPPSSRAAEVEPENVEWTYGTILSWSSLEGQGIVLSDTDAEARYVLRDPVENVIAYQTKQHLLRKGRKVKFTTFGSTGKLVCNAVLLDSEAEEATLREEALRPKEPHLSLDGNMNEAIPSPMSTSYWLNRMDKAGYDTKEVKDMQNRALTLDEDDDDDGTEGGKFLDSEELLKKDHWWNDPRKNVRFPNSDMTAGHLALIGPASMMNVAMKTKDPKKLDKMLKKYQSRLTEDQKEYAWKQAKEMAPKYEACVRKGRERNEEPKFYFF